MQALREDINRIEAGGFEDGEYFEDEEYETGYNSVSLGCMAVGFDGASEQKPRVVRVQVDSGADISVWPTSLWASAAPTVVTADSHAGKRYWGAGDCAGPSIPDQGRRDYQLELADGSTRRLRVRCAPVRHALLSVAGMVDEGHDVSFTAERAYARHRLTGEVTEFVRRGGRFGLDVRVRASSFHGRAHGL